MAETITELHNRLAPLVIETIMQPMLRANADARDILVLLESIVAGALAFLVKIGGDEAVLDVFTEGIRTRMARIRLGDTHPAGQA